MPYLLWSHLQLHVITLVWKQRKNENNSDFYFIGQKRKIKSTPCRQWFNLILRQITKIFSYYFTLVKERTSGELMLFLWSITSFKAKERKRTGQNWCTINRWLLLSNFRNTYDCPHRFLSQEKVEFHFIERWPQKKTISYIFHWNNYSPTMTEVKQIRAWSPNRWGTSWQYQVL